MGKPHLVEHCAVANRARQLEKALKVFHSARIVSLLVV